MLEYITREDYIRLLSAESIPSNLKNLTIEASNYINYKTFGRIDGNNVSEQVKYATCLIVNLINEQETKISEIGNLTRQDVEGWSESYAKPEEIRKDYEEKKHSVLKQYLCNEIGTDGLPLLYCGVC